jgi:signal transduction histidine kinase
MLTARRTAVPDSGLDRRSLRWRLPWAFAVTAVLIVAAYGLGAYRAVREDAFAATRARLASALAQVRTISELGAIALRDQLNAAAGSAAIVDALRSSDPVSSRAIGVLRPLAGVDSSATVELLRRDGSLRFALTPPAERQHGSSAVTWPDSATVGPLVELDGHLAFSSLVAVRSGRSVIGGIRVTRTLKQSSANQKLVAGQLGPDAVFLVGNAGGALWSPTGIVRRGVVESAATYSRGGSRWVSVVAPVKGTPWVYAVELPEQVALGRAQRIIPPFAVTGILIALAGAAVGWHMSRRITSPLAELTAATEAIVRGDHDVPLVATERDDEIGRLARSFATMVQFVRGEHTRLEAEVMTRTGELSTAVGQLRVLHDELRESERFATLGRLSGSVGHELRNPLGVMSNVVFLIDALPDASPRLREYANLLREQIRVSDRIISDLLDRARSGAPVRSRVNVDRLIEDLLLRVDVPASITVERRNMSPLPDVVLDRDQVTQILWNLVMNAVQAMRGGPGRLVILTGYSNGRLRIEVRDSGPGIPANVRDRVFDPMYSTKAEGVGLGLSISRAFARANGGDLVLAEGDESGATFVLDIPVTQALADPPGAAAGPSNRSLAAT